jgi:VCBS repeat-containing protein
VLSVVLTDAAGNISDPGTITTEDELAPDAPTNLTFNEQDLDLAGRGEPGATVTVTDNEGNALGTATVGGDGVFVVVLDREDFNGQPVNVVLTDEDGNASPITTAITPDLVPPVAPENVAANPEQTAVSGEGEAGAIVIITNDAGVEVGRGLIDETGAFTVPLTPPQTGEGSLTVVLQDAAGNTSPSVSVDLDDVQPPAPPFNLIVSDDGETLTGEGEPGTRVEVRNDDGDLVAQGEVDVAGSFSIELDPPQITGAELDVTLIDDAGNISQPGTVFAPDPDAPPAPTGVSVIDDGATLVGFGEPGTTVQVTNQAGIVVGRGPVDDEGDFVITLDPVQNDGGDLRVVLLGPGGISQPAFAPTPDLTAPEPAANLTLDAENEVLMGLGEPGASVRVTDGQGTVLGTGTVGTNGAFMITLDPAPANGGDLTVVLTDAEGNASDPTTLTAPDVGAPDAPEDLEVTADGTTLTGTGEPDATITVTNADGLLVGTATAGADGSFTVTLDPPQIDTRDLAVVQEDLAGNISLPAIVGAPDGIAPEPATALIFSDDGVTLTGRGEAGATVTVTNADGDVVGTGVVEQDGEFTVTFTPPQDTGGVLDVVLTDAAGNTSDPSSVSAPDDIGPGVPGNLDVNDAGTLLAGTGEAGSTVTVTNAAGIVVGVGTVGENGQFSVPLAPAQTDGGDLSVVLADVAGNPSAPGIVASPDLIDPLAPTELAVTAGGTVLNGEGEPGATVRVTTAAGVLLGTAVVDADGLFSVPLSPAQRDGSALTVVLEDAAGNVSDPGIVLSPDLVAPAPPADLAIDASGTEITGTGEPGATVTVTNNGTTVGTGTVGADGSFSIGLSPAQVDGDELEVVLEDDAGNISDPGTVVAPGLDFALTDVDDTASLNETVTFRPETTPSTDTATVESLVVLQVADLATVDLGGVANPVVDFTLSENTNTVTFDLRVGGLLGVGALSNFSVVVEEWINGTWVRTDDLENPMGDGILGLSLLGSTRQGTVTLEDLDAGTYRATLVPNPGVRLGVGTFRTISVRATDEIENVTVAVGDTADGNFIDAAATGVTDDLQVSSVRFDGQSYTLGGGEVTVAGEFGTLVIDADGNYTYTPDLDATGGGTDTFAVTVVDPDTGRTQTADLGVDVEVNDTSTLMAASDDVVTLAFADDGDAVIDGDGADPSPDNTADDPSDNADAPIDGEALLADDESQEIDLSALDGGTEDALATTDGSTGSDTVDGAVVTETVEVPPLDPFEPVNQDDDLSSQRLPVV